MREERMTKARLSETARARRAEWDAALARVPLDRMTEPGVAGAWSVKDIIAHVTSYERWLGDRMHEILRGEVYVQTEIDRMSLDERNEVGVQRERERTPEETLAASRAAFARLLAAVEAHDEAFLTEPQHFEGARGAIVVWETLRGDVYDHYRQHLPDIERWLAGLPGPAAT